jgi:RNA polymerase sigma factor (sigma-70 family)
MRQPTRGAGAHHGADAALDDADLAALRSGDAEALERALIALLPRVRRWLRRLLGPRVDLDDATQDALNELARALPRFEGRSSLSTMAHTVTVRVAYQHYDRRKRSREIAILELVPPPPDSIDPELRAMGREALQNLYRCLDKLHATRRVAFILCAVEGLSPSEAAAVEGISPAAMRVRLTRARGELERLLRGDAYLAAFMGGGK